MMFNLIPLTEKKERKDGLPEAAFVILYGSMKQLYMFFPPLLVK